MRQQRKKTGTREWAEHNKNIDVGCRHGCHYCVSENSLVLLPDLSEKSIRDIQIGEKVIGVSSGGLTEAIVTHKYKLRRNGFRIYTYSNLLPVVCSEDHRWLTSRSWKYTFGTECGKNRRPHLTMKSLMSSVSSTYTNKIDDSLNYRKGYLSGIIRGDGLLKSFDYSGKRRNKDIQYQFRLVLLDKDFMAVERTREFLDYFDITARWFRFTKTMSGIRTSQKSDYFKIKDIIKFDPSNLEFKRGFLAGIFDAEGNGGNRKSVIRICNQDTKIIDDIEESLSSFSFNFKREIACTNRKSILYNVRIMGGFFEHLRFYQLVNPALKRKFKWRRMKHFKSHKIKSIEDLGKEFDMYDITTSTGNFICNGLISHNCYASSNAMRFRRVKDYEEWMSPTMNRNGEKENPVKLQGRIMFPTTHDICPENLDRVEAFLKKWLYVGNEFLIVSKPHPDCIDRLTKSLHPYMKQITFRFTIGSNTPENLSFWEPGAPSYNERKEALKLAFFRGFKTSVSCEPYYDTSIFEVVTDLLPFINDVIWIGKMNQISRRVHWDDIEDNRKVIMKPILEMVSTDNYVRLIYDHFKDNPKVKWKDSMKTILGLPQEDIG